MKPALPLFLQDVSQLHPTLIKTVALQWRSKVTSYQSTQISSRHSHIQTHAHTHSQSLGYQMKTRQTYTLAFLIRSISKTEQRCWHFDNLLKIRHVAHPRQRQQETRERAAVTQLKPASMKVKDFLFLLLVVWRNLRRPV